MGQDARPKTDMEQSIADILKEGGVGSEKQIEDFEKLKMREMDDAEAELRFRELGRKGMGDRGGLRGVLRVRELLVVN